MHRVLAATLGLSLLTLTLGACSQLQSQTSPPNEIVQPLQVSIGTPAQDIALNSDFPVQVSITGAEPSSEIAVVFTGVAGIQARDPAVTISADESGRASFQTMAIVSSRTHSSLIAGVRSGNHSATASLDVVFDTPAISFAAQSVGATGDTGRVIDIEQYYASIPTVTDDDYVTAYERSLHPTRTKTSADSATGLPSTILVENITYMRQDGTRTEPMSGIEYRLPNTGGGVPLPGELDGIPPDGFDAARTINPQGLGCGQSTATLKFTQIIDYNYNSSGSPTTPIIGNMPKGTYFRAVDNNAGLPDYILFEGWVGNNGNATITISNCDTSTWFDYSKPDVYFIFETRNNIGLTASHGTFIRRHWWRTNTYYNYAAQDLQGMTIQAIGDNAEALNMQRLWAKINSVYDWDRSAFSNMYSSFRADVLYPVFTYWGTAVVSRAAIGQMQMVYGDAHADPAIFHEFGHLAYYRRMMGESAYNSAHSCNMSSGCVQFPACGGCINHTLSANIGPEAAMIEGWADFFEGVAMTNVPGAHSKYGEYWDISTVMERPTDFYTLPSGQGNELRVAAFLWDMYDSYAGDDENLSHLGDAKARYRHVGGYFANMPLSSELANVWTTRIKPTLATAQRRDYCAALKLNTLGSLYPIPSGAPSNYCTTVQ